MCAFFSEFANQKPILLSWKLLDYSDFMLETQKYFLPKKKLNEHKQFTNIEQKLKTIKSFNVNFISML